MSEVGNRARFGGGDEAVPITTASITEPASGPLGRLGPVRRKWPWIIGGLVLQLIGVGAPVAYVIGKARHENFGGSLTRATVRFAWHEAVHSHAGLAFLIGGAVVFAAGGVLLARPFAKSWLMLLVAVPIAALAGVLVLGAAALLVGVAVAGFDSVFDGGSGGGSSGGGSSAADWVDYPTDSRYDQYKRKKQRQPGPSGDSLSG